MSEDRTQLLGQLCDLLEQHGVVAVALTYAGSDDNGGIEDVEECIDDGSSANSRGCIDFDEAMRSNSQDKLKTKIPKPEWCNERYIILPAKLSLEEIIKLMAYKFIPAGFEDNDGGEGNVLISVAKRQLVLRHDTRQLHWDRSVYKAPKPIKPQRTMANQKSVRKVKK